MRHLEVTMKEIYLNNRFTKINADTRSPRNFKELLGFLKCNNGRDCFCKFQGKVYMVTKDLTWKEVCKNVSDLTFNEYLKLSL